jgi:serine protease Do
LALKLKIGYGRHDFYRNNAGTHRGDRSPWSFAKMGLVRPIGPVLTPKIGRNYMLRTTLLTCLVIGGLFGGYLAGTLLHGQATPPPASSNIPKELTSYRDVVKTVLPAVVSIQGKIKPRSSTVRRRERDDESSDQRSEAEEFMRRFFGSDPFGPAFRVPDNDRDDTPRVGFGSGFLIDPKGVILTNYHVVHGADQVEVHLQDGRVYSASDIKSDQKTDLAIVRITVKEPLPYLVLGDSDTMEIGDRVLAIGAPFRLTGTVTAGIISANHRSLAVNMYEDFIQTDASINPGNSGGPLVNLAGQVIGINSAIKSVTGGWQGIGMAISSNMASSIVKALMREGVVHRGYLGVQVGDLTADVATQLGLDNTHGVVVSKVYDNSPAAKADIKEGDVITQIGGKPVNNSKDLQREVISLPLNQPEPLRLFRDGKEVDKEVTILEQPASYGLVGATPRQRSRGGDDSQSISLDKIGMSVTDLTQELAQRAGFKEDAKGALITHVDENSIASEQGLQPRMLVIKANKKAITSAEQLQEIVEKAPLESGLLIQVQLADGTTAYRVLKSAAVK